jgi:hypothetical protein
MQRSTSFAATAVVVLLAAVHPANAGDKESLAACANAAAYGPVKKGITVAGHDFNCHPIRVAKQADLAAAGKSASPHYNYYKGKLSHALRLRPDDQVEYLITFELTGGCRLRLPEVKINRGGFINVAKRATDLFGVRESDWRSLAKKLEGDWETTANVVVLASVTKWAEQFPHCRKVNW